MSLYLLQSMSAKRFHPDHFISRTRCSCCYCSLLMYVSCVLPSERCCQLCVDFQPCYVCVDSQVFGNLEDTECSRCRGNFLSRTQKNHQHPGPSNTSHANAALVILSTAPPISQRFAPFIKSSSYPVVQTLAAAHQEEIPESLQAVWSRECDGLVELCRTRFSFASC